MAKGSGHTTTGKLISRKNSLRHGILSKGLFLNNEDPKQFRKLLAALSDTLCPVGFIEELLVEKLATNIWRQQRLVKAETANIALQQCLDIPKTQELVKNTTGTAPPSRQSDPISAQASSSEQAMIQQHQQKIQDTRKEMLQDFRTEYDQISPLREQLTEVELIKQVAPALVRWVIIMTRKHHASPEENLKAIQDDFWYWADLVADNPQSPAASAPSPTGSASADNCAGTESSSSQESSVTADEIIEVVKAVYSAPFNLPLMGRYSTMLNNEFFKTLKAFREEQEWRLKTIEGSATDPPGN